MTHEDYIDNFKTVVNEMTALTAAKNRDYSAAADAFANFNLIEKITEGRISREDGILVRMTDKLTRVAHLLAREAAVKDEKITDTVRDLAVYSIILELALKDRAESEAKEAFFDALPKEPREVPIGDGTTIKIPGTVFHASPSGKDAVPVGECGKASPQDQIEHSKYWEAQVSAKWQAQLGQTCARPCDWSNCKVASMTNHGASLK